MKRRLLGVVSAAVILVGSALGARHLLALSPAGPSGYHLIKSIPMGGDTGWDYLLVDSRARRVYVSRGTQYISRKKARFSATVRSP